MKQTKIKHAQIQLAPSRDEGLWKSSSIMITDMNKRPVRNVEYTTRDDLRAQARIFAKTRPAYDQARSFEATDMHTKGAEGVEVHLRCLDARKPAGWKQFVERKLYHFPDPVEDAILEGRAGRDM